jgi:transglutaminase-like putative cysteine protease
MRLTLSHQTHYTYARPVSISHQLLRLTPRDLPRQQLLSHEIHVSPEPEATTTRQDSFGNELTEIFIQDYHKELIINAHAIVEIAPPAEFLFDLSPAWERAAEALQSPTHDGAFDAAAFGYPSPRIELAGARAFAETVFTPGKPLLRAALDLTEKIHAEFDYQGGVTDVHTPVPDVLAAGKGVCQDFAHVAIACLRTFGLPARYVSGYLLTNSEPNVTALVGADASHAWFSVWCPEFGWVDFDPTNNLIPNQKHITLGWGRDYGDISPTTGFIHGGGKQRLEVAVQISVS